MEGYFFQSRCVEKALALGIASDKLHAQNLLKNILTVGRVLSALRLLSDDENLNLPFQHTDVSRCISFSKTTGRIELDLKRYVTTLLQNANQSLNERVALIERVHNLHESLTSISDYELLHGKDAIRLLEKILSNYGIPKSDAIRILRASFERVFINDYPALSSVNQYLKGEI
jgi:hypothetical protein